MEPFWSPAWMLLLGMALGVGIAALVWAGAGWHRRAEQVLEPPVPDGVDTALEVIGATGVVLDCCGARDRG
jgi:hypothetical protein